MAPLTLLAGANSSGKSSAMQPLLLLKQTLEAKYDPGALLLNGPNVRFTSAEQLLSRQLEGGHEDRFSISVGLGEHGSIQATYVRQPGRGFSVEETVFRRQDGEGITLRLGMGTAEFFQLLVGLLKTTLPKEASYWEAVSSLIEFEPVVDRWFLTPLLHQKAHPGHLFVDQMAGIEIFDVSDKAQLQLLDLIHLPGLRGNPERAYPSAKVGHRFPGTFETYVASTIAHWQESGASRELEGTRADLARLGLNWTVSAQRVNDTEVGIQVGRSSRGASGRTEDMVNIADVGFGVSQTLPVLVALQAARPGQMVLIEQPELHLHPRAQTAMAQVLVQAAKRGVRIVAETHSSLLLLGVQTLVARGELPGQDVQLHWFTQDEAGYSQVRSTTLDDTGGFGDWPEDFAETVLQAQADYLDVVEEAGRKQ